MALTLRTLNDARTLLTKALAELQLDGENTTELSNFTLSEANLSTLSAWLDKAEARVFSAQTRERDEQWALIAQDEVWARVETELPNFGNLLDDPRTRRMAKRIMRLLVQRRCQAKAG